MDIRVGHVVKSLVTALVVTGVLALAMPLFGIDDHLTLVIAFVGMVVMLSAYETWFDTKA